MFIWTVYWLHFLYGMLFPIYCIVMFCVGLEIFSCFMHSWIENASEDDTEKGTHTSIWSYAHTMQTDRETVREEGHIASPRNVVFFLPTSERNEEMGWEKRLRWMAASCCHTPAKRTERRALSHRIRVSCSHTRPASIHPAAGRAE